MESIILEIHAAEGGRDSQLLVKDFMSTYIKVAQNNKLSYSILEDRLGFTSLLIEGQGAKAIFRNEPGGHRVQRVSPTEKRGRVHTSTVTVAVLDSNKNDYNVPTKDIMYYIARGSGAGGQKRNVTSSCVTAVYKPTGLSVKIDSRDQNKNKILATRILIERLKEIANKKSFNERSSKRKNQVGSGMRGDKRRTYRYKDDTVVDHITNQRWQLSRWVRGEW